MKHYPVAVEVVVRPGDIDALAHVNNATYFQFFEIARDAYFARLVEMPATVPARSAFGWMVESTCCRFRALIGYPDTLVIGAKVAALSDDGLLMKYRAVSKKSRKVAAEGDSLLVAYDFAAGCATGIGEDIKETIRQLEGRAALPRVPGYPEAIAGAWYRPADCEPR